MGGKRKLATWLFASTLLAAACSSSSGSGTSTTSSASGACDPYNGSVTQGPNGAHCDSSGDCAAPTCKCADGTVNDGQHLCSNGICDGDKACSLFCASHGGAGPCDAGTD